MSRKVEAWAVTRGGEIFGNPFKRASDCHAAGMELADDFPTAEFGVVRLIPAPDPKLARLDAAVLRLADEWENDKSGHPDGWVKLRAAIVSRREKALKSCKGKKR